MDSLGSSILEGLAYGGLVTGTMALAWLVLPLWIASIKRRVAAIEEEHAARMNTDRQVLDLLRRVAHLEATVRELTGARAADAAVEPAPVADRGVPAPRTAPTPIPTRPPEPPAVPTPVRPPIAVPTPPATPAAAPREPVVSSPRDVAVPPASAGASARGDAPSPAAPPAPVAPAAAASPRIPPARPVATPEPEPVAAAGEPAGEAWELVVGTSWLNKIGVLVTVIGIALLVGYSMTHVGPAGRVAMGYVMSVALLGAGVWLERRDEYRTYGHGLVAGGWAGVYFTTYAMRAVPAAQVIESDLVAGVLLAGVAAGMIGHSFRYQSRTVTALAFVVAYVTLAIAPLSWFALVASLPLAVAVLVTSQRFGWTNVSVLGIAATYGLFAVRGPEAAAALADPRSLAPAGLLALYWLLFEGADILGLRGGRHGGGTAQSLLGLNAAGFVGCSMLAVPPDEPVRFSVLLGLSGLAYLASAVLRRRILAAGGRTGEAVRQFTTFHTALALSTALIVWSTGLRYDEVTLGTAWLVEAQVLVAAGFVLADPWVRKIGGVVFGLTVVLAAGLVLSEPGELFTPGLFAATPLLVATAVAGYVNREWLRRREIDPAALESGYASIATILVGVVLAVEVPAERLGLAFLLLHAALLEAGLRRAEEYRLQSYMAGLLGTVITLVYFGPAGSTRDLWFVLPSAVLLLWLTAVRLGRRAGAGVGGEFRQAAVAASWAGTALLALFEWRVTADDWLGPALAATGAAFVALGLARRLVTLRWQGYTLLLGGAAVAFGPLMPDLVGRGPTTTEIVALLITIALIYGSSLAARRAASERAGSSEPLALGALASAAAFMLVVLQWREVPAAWSGAVVAATGLLHIGSGVAGPIRLSRWHGYLMLLAASWRGIGPILLPDPSAAEIVNLVAVIGLLYASAALVFRRAAPDETEQRAVGGLFLLGTTLLATLEWRVLDAAWSGPALAATAGAFFVAGALRGLAAGRWQGYALWALAALRAIDPVVAPGAAAPSVIAGLVLVLLAGYGMALAARHLIDQPDRTESQVAPIMLVTATVLATTLVVAEVPTDLVTLTLGLLGLALFATGLPAHERVLRLSGLVLLLGCILKLFLYDLRELEALARIFSFVILGLVLLGVSWAYTRFGDTIRKYL